MQSVAAMCPAVLKSHRVVQDERRKASMRKRMNTTGGEEKWFLAPGTHMNAFQVGASVCSAFLCPKSISHNQQAAACLAVARMTWS